MDIKLDMKLRMKRRWMARSFEIEERERISSNIFIRILFFGLYIYNNNLLLYLIGIFLIFILLLSLK